MGQGRTAKIRTADDTWMDRAYCRINGVSPEHFFADDGKPYSAVGRRACSKCDVRLECLEYGKAMNACGLWGGRSLRYGRLRREEFDQDFACKTCGTGFIPYGKASTYCSKVCQRKASQMRGVA